jgi:hypothetical protein
MWKAFVRCGAVQISPRFVGRYEVDASRSFRGPIYDRPDSGAWFLERQTDQFSNFVIERDRIRSGTLLVQEFCFIDIEAQTDQVLDAVALWHEDVHDPGDASLIKVRIERDGGEARFYFYANEKDTKGKPVFLRGPR